MLIAVAAAGLWGSGGSGRFAFFAAEAPQSEPETGLPQPAQTLFLQVAAEGGAQQMGIPLVRRASRLCYPLFFHQWLQRHAGEGG